jgi:hypothetical protein
MDLMDIAFDVPLQDGYVRDNDGGIHSYILESGNIYYGHYGTIHNGEVRKLPESEYFQLDYHTYVKKGSSGEVVDLKPSDEQSQFNLYDETKFTQEDDGTCSVVFLEDGEPVYTYSYNEDKKHNLVGLAMVVHEGATIGSIRHSPALSSIDIGKGAIMYYIGHNPALSSIDIGKGATIYYIEHNPALSSLNIGKGAKVDRITNNPALFSINIGKGATIDSIRNNHPDIIITDLRKDKN